MQGSKYAVGGGGLFLSCENENGRQMWYFSQTKPLRNWSTKTFSKKYARLPATIITDFLLPFYPKESTVRGAGSAADGLEFEPWYCRRPYLSQTGSGAHPAYYPMGTSTWKYFPWGTAAGESNWLLTYNQCRGQEHRYSMHPLPTRLPDVNFTLYLNYTDRATAACRRT
jgi:hypothetical protein